MNWGGINKLEVSERKVRYCNVEGNGPQGPLKDVMSTVNSLQMFFMPSQSFLFHPP